MTFNRNDYPAVTFSSKETNATVRKSGIGIGKYLAIASGGKPRHYKIYYLLSGKPVLDSDFSQIETAAYLANIINSHYAKYFTLLQNDVEWDVIAVTRYTIPDGIRLYEMMEILRTYETVQMEDINRAWEDAEPLAEKWKSVGGYKYG